MIPLATCDELAADLAQAERSRQPIGPLTAAHPEIDVVDAYEIQLINIRQRVAEGARVVGHKVGLSSLAMQQMMGVDEPDYGHLLNEMQVFEDTPVKADKYLCPRVEVEVGFILAHDLPGAACTEDDVLKATEAFVPSIELIDTRITDWKIALCDTIADNASSAGFVLGAGRVAPTDIDITAIDAVLTRNGEVVAKGRSDGRTVILVPEIKEAEVVGMTLLHVEFQPYMEPTLMRRVLSSYRGRYNALADAVTETEPVFDDARLGLEPIVELLTEPVYELAKRWRGDAD